MYMFEMKGPGDAQVALDHLDIFLLAYELDVEQTRYLQLPAQLLADLPHAALRLHENVLGRQRQRGIPAVDAGVLDVFHDGIV